MKLRAPGEERPATNDFSLEIFVREGRKFLKRVCVAYCYEGLRLHAKDYGGIDLLEAGLFRSDCQTKKAQSHVTQYD